MRLDMHSRQEILKASFEDYQKVTKKGRKELVDRLVLDFTPLGIHD
jgi:hypothetical protein